MTQVDPNRSPDDPVGRAVHSVPGAARAGSGTAAGVAGGPGAAGAGAGAAASAMVSLAGRREVISACRAALAGLRGVLVACTEKDLTVLAGELAEIRALSGAGLAAITAEAETRGLIAASQFASTAAWVADTAWHSRREAATVAKTAALLRQADYQPVADAVGTGDLDMRSAVACAQQYANLADDLTESAKPAVLEHLLDMACDHGPAGVRRLADEILARYSTNDALEKQCERRRRFIDLSPGRHTEAGLWHYRLTVDSEGRAVLEAAIGPGSAPQPSTITGCGDIPPGAAGSNAPGPAGDATQPAARGGGLQVTTRDSRPVGRRRGEALINALRRCTAYAEHGQPTASPKAIVMLTMNYADLTSHTDTRRRWFGRHGQLGPDAPDTAALDDATPPGAAARGRTGPEIPGAAVVLGSLATGELISPETARKIACDAGIIPVVLGRHGEILNHGGLQRLFTLAQVRALWRRDRHCTFPGCDTPAAWCDAHHLVHWADGGRTDLSNAALLCPRHHTIVHRDQLAGHVHPAKPPPGSTTRSGPPGGPTPGHPPGATPRGPIEDPPERRAPAVTWDLHPNSYQPSATRHPDEEQLSA